MREIGGKEYLQTIYNESVLAKEKRAHPAHGRAARQHCRMLIIRQWCIYI